MRYFKSVSIVAAVIFASFSIEGADLLKKISLGGLQGGDQELLFGAGKGENVQISVLQNKYDDLQRPEEEGNCEDFSGPKVDSK